MAQRITPARTAQAEAGQSRHMVALEEGNAKSERRRALLDRRPLGFRGDIRHRHQMVLRKKCLPISWPIDKL